MQLTVRVCVAWTVDLHFREIKNLLGLDVLRCLSPEMVRKEIAMHRIAYNLVRLLMQRASITHHVSLSRLSFKGTLDSLHQLADAIHALAGHPRKQSALLDQLLRAIAKDLLPVRPNRSEPRAKKRRAKNYHLLTSPRRKMNVPPHRNRPEKIVRPSKRGQLQKIEFRLALRPKWKEKWTHGSQNTR